MLWHAITEAQRLTSRGQATVPAAKLFADHGNTKPNRARWHS